MNKDPYRYFRIEANELLDQLAKNVLDLEKGNCSTELIMRLLRLAHTLKGAARVVKQTAIADLAHQLEESLAVYRNETRALPRNIINSVLTILDEMTAQLAMLPVSNVPETSTLAPDNAVRILRTDLIEVDMVLESLGEIGNELGLVRRAIDSMEHIRNLVSQIAGQRTMPQAKLQSTSEQIRSMLGEVERSVSAGLLRIDHELREARDTAERIRLTPISSIFNTLERTARDAAHSTGKLVEFKAIGGEIRIDGVILDTLQNALIQLVRNAVAHGIEFKAQRDAIGKPGTGQITLEIERRGYRALFRCIDDGAGIDLEAVRQALHKKGMAHADTKKLDAQDLMTLLLKGGLSTTSIVTEISGRGIGLDLVREAMQNLDGEVVVKSEVGRGTTIELSVPLSLATLDVLIVESGGIIASLPMNSVRRTLRLMPEEIMHAPHGAFILFEGQQISIAPLHLGQPQHSKKAGALTAVIVTSSDGISAVMVDRLCGMDTVVLRALSAVCPADPIVLGVHLDNDGNPRLVLNPDVLVTQQWITDPKSEAMLGEQILKKSPAPILIIDDSLTTRMLECSILESAGFAVEMATCAEEGLAMAHQKHYALFLVDVEMPGMNGFSFVEYTQTDPVLRAVPSILVTSCDSTDDRQRGAASGARAYIVKGEFDQTEFLERITELVQT